MHFYSEREHSIVSKLFFDMTDYTTDYTTVNMAKMEVNREMSHPDLEMRPVASIHIALYCQIRSDAISGRSREKNSL